MSLKRTRLRISGLGKPGRVLVCSTLPLTSQKAIQPRLTILSSAPETQRPSRPADLTVSLSCNNCPLLSPCKAPSHDAAPKLPSSNKSALHPTSFCS